MFTSTSAHRLRSGSFPLPEEVGTEIAEKPITSVKDAAEKQFPSPDNELKTNAAARGRANLPLVSKQVRGMSLTALNRHPDVAAASFENAIDQCSEQAPHVFAANVKRLVLENRHISANMAWLSQRQRAALMTILARATHLQNFCFKCDGTAQGDGDIPSPDYSAWEMQLALIAENNPNLEHMVFAMKRIADVPLPQLISLVKENPKLTHFTFDQVEVLKDMENAWWDGEFQDASATWGDVLKVPHLTHVRISECGLDNEDAIDLAEQLPEANATHLDLSHNEFEAEGIAAIAEGLKKAKVTDLNLHRALASADVSLTSFVDALPQTNVSNLRLRGWSSHNDTQPSMVKQEDVVRLAGTQGRNGAKLIKLDVSRNTDLGDPVASAFAMSMESSSCVLRHLNLSMTKMTATGAKDLANTLRSKVALRELDVSWNPQLGDTAAIDFAEAISSPDFALTHLNLSKTGMTDVGARKLLEALQRPGCKLTHLNIEDNDISPELKQEIYASLGIDREKMTEVLGENVMQSKDHEFWRSGLNVNSQFFREN